MTKLLSISLTALLLFLLTCSSTKKQVDNSIGYNLSTPDKLSVLPDTLREVSGLTTIDSTTFACIQDENGIIFIYDTKKDKIARQYKFGLDGDYEGITKVGDTIYVLRSDGMLFEVADYRSNSFKVRSFNTGIPSGNNEGLCYDLDNNRLLIACKEKIGKGPQFKDKRAIYGFNLQTKKLTSVPVFDFDVQKAKEFALKNKISLPAKTRKNKGQTVTEPFIKFRPSAICIHPQTKDLFLLSASDHLLFIFNKVGDIKHIKQLNPTVFNKAEGVTFHNNGDMLITNEGQDKKPTVLFFRYNRN